MQTDIARSNANFSKFSSIFANSALGQKSTGGVASKATNASVLRTSRTGTCAVRINVIMV
jgi:hypothetical protein